MTGARSTTVRLLALLAGRTGWLALGALLGFLAIGSNIALMAVSAYLVSRAALLGTGGAFAALRDAEMVEAPAA